MQITQQNKEIWGNINHFDIYSLTVKNYPHRSLIYIIIINVQ